MKYRNKTRWHSSPESVPYTPHLCMLDINSWCKPVMIAKQMGHENAQRVYKIYGAWIEEMNNEQVRMLNAKLAL